MKWYERLKIAREAQGLRKSHFAAMVGVKPPTVTEWERGDTASPSMDNTLKICEVLKITPEWLMYGDGASGHQAFNSEKNKQLQRAMEIMKGLEGQELSQVLAILETFGSRTSPQTTRPQKK